MCAPLRPLLVIGLLCGLVCYQPAVALVQTKMNADPDPWDIVQATPSGTELEVQLHNSTRLKGKLLTASATMLRLSRRNEIAELHRDDVRKIYRLSARSDEFRRMTRNVGALTGAAIGLEAVKDRQSGYFLLPALGGALGSFGGYAVGNRMKSRLLIYDSQPRLFTEARSSRSDQP